MDACASSPTSTSSFETPGPSVVMERRRVWKGRLEWDDASDGTRTGSDCVITCAGKFQQLDTENWRENLVMQLLPKFWIGTFGTQFFREAVTVMFHFDSQDHAKAEALRRTMAEGAAGCVHVPLKSCGPGTPMTAANVKIIIMMLSGKHQAFVGFIPFDQAGMIARFKEVVLEEKIRNVSLVPAASAVSPRIRRLYESPQDTGPPQRKRRRSDDNRCQFWRGRLRWLKAKLPETEKWVCDTLSCSVACHVEDMDLLDVGNWPDELVIQMIRAGYIDSVGKIFVKRADTVYLDMEPFHMEQSVKAEMAKGCVGCVYLRSSGPSAGHECRVKSFVVMYSPNRGGYVGFVPHDQVNFSYRIEKVIRELQHLRQLVHEHNSRAEQLDVVDRTNRTADVQPASGSIPKELEFPWDADSDVAVAAVPAVSTSAASENDDDVSVIGYCTPSSTCSPSSSGHAAS